MVGIGLAGVLTLVAAQIFGQVPEAPPPTQGPYGVSDEQLWHRIVNSGGDPLGKMTFAGAVAKDPRRVEALILQRVVVQFYQAINRLQEPTVDSSMLDEAMRRVYLMRNDAMRKASGHEVITAPQISAQFRESWGAQAELLRVATEMSTPEAAALRGILITHYAKIQRAFRESREIAERAAPLAQSPACAAAWREVAATLQNMCDTISTLIVQREGDSYAPEASFPMTAPTSFGAIEDGDADDVFGRGEWEEFVVSGHRSPALALPQWRRSGGRFY